MADDAEDSAAIVREEHRDSGEESWGSTRPGTSG